MDSRIHKSQYAEVQTIEKVQKQTNRFVRICNTNIHVTVLELNA